MPFHTVPGVVHDPSLFRCPNSGVGAPGRQIVPCASVVDGGPPDLPFVQRLDVSRCALAPQ